MDFLVKLLQSSSKKGGSGHSPSHNGSLTKTSSKGVEIPSKFEAVEIVKPEEKPKGEESDWQERTAVITKVDHETYVQFAREFVEELVATAHNKSEKELSQAVETETHSITSLSVSEGSFQSADHSNGNPSAYLPDLLQPEAVYKRQTETDTDTNEYESAAETEPPDVSEFRDLGSPSEGVLVDEVITSHCETPLNNSQSLADTTVISTEVDVLHIKKDAFSLVSAAGIGDSFIDKFERLKIDGSFVDPEKSADSSAEESEYLPCDSSFVESESFSNNSISDSSPVDCNAEVSDSALVTSESCAVASNEVKSEVAPIDSTFVIPSEPIEVEEDHPPKVIFVEHTEVLEAVNETEGLTVVNTEATQQAESIYLGAGDSNSLGVKEISFTSSSFEETSSFNGNETVILAPKECENEIKHEAHDKENPSFNVGNEIPVQEDIFSKLRDESSLLTELRELCHSQEENLKETDENIDFIEKCKERTPPQQLLYIDCPSSEVCESDLIQVVKDQTEDKVNELLFPSSTDDKFQSLEEAGVDFLDLLALEAAKISQELLIEDCRKSLENCDNHGSISFPLEEDDSNGSSSQDMTDSSSKVEGHSPINRQSSPQLSKSSNLSEIPQSEVANVNSSELEIDPFRRRSKLNASPPTVNESAHTEVVDPFKRSSHIQSSPPPEVVKKESDYPHHIPSVEKDNRKSSAVENSPIKVTDKVTIDQVASPSPVLNPEVNLSEAGPDIAQDEIFQSGDVFKDPSTFDFLSQVGNSNPSVNLRTESLYVKFDPLYSGVVTTTNKNIRLPPSIMANSAGDASNAMTSANSKAKAKVQDSLELTSTGSTPKKEKALELDNKNLSDVHCRSPATPKSPNVMKAGTPTESHLESPTLASNGCIDQGTRPVSMVGGLLPGGLTMAEVSMARELLARKEAEMEERVAQERLRAEAAEKRATDAEEREKEALKLVAEKTQVENQMSVIMQEYEKTISRVVAEKEQAKQKWEIEQENLKRERDEALTHLNNVEQAFSDVHRKYERSKTAIEGFKRNEDALTASMAECQANLRKQEQRYEVLKSHAEAQLEGANQELESVRRAQQLEITKLRAMLKKTELRLVSLEESVDQKEKENQELVAICDELISKLGAHGVDAGK